MAKVKRKKDSWARYFVVVVALGVNKYQIIQIL